MAERVILQWNVPNWITVFLMVTIGYVIVAIGMQFLGKTNSGGG